MSSFAKDLPKTWEMTTLGEAYQVIGGGTPSTEMSDYWGGDTPWITSADIEGVRQINIRKYVTEKGIAGSTTNKVPPKTLLVVTRVGLGKIAIAETPICFSQDLQGLIQNPKLIFPEYTLYLLSYELQFLKFDGRGTTISGVTKKQLKDLGFPLPPLPEQHRIVAKIEELFSDLDKGIENLKTARAQLKVYRQALLKHAFAGKGLVQKKIIAQPFGEECIFTLRDVIQTLGQGWSPRCLETPSQSDDVWGVIRTTAIQPLHFDDTKNKQLPTGLTPRPHLEIVSGDVLITRAGPRTRVGIACFVKNTRPKLMVCDKAYRIQVHKEKILPQYLVMLLNTSEVLSELEKLKSGISDSGLNLTQDKFLTLKIMVPTLEYQQFILDDIEEKLTNVAFLETQIEDSLQQAEALRQSILKKAFSGQLVVQDANDEPASALLARIKAEKTVQAAMAKQRKPQKVQVQPAPAKPNVIPFPVKIGNISATDLHAGIIAMACLRHEQSPKFLKHFHHVKVEKIGHLVEAHLGIDLERVPFKDAAGPNDYPHLKKVESRARKANWFEVHQQQTGGAYVFNKKHGFDALLDKTATALGERIAEVDALLKLLLPLNTRQAEIVATLYAAWNNLLLLGRSPQDEDVVYEARENWHESKLKIDREKFFKGLEWMRNQGLVPAGRGQYVSGKSKRKTTKRPT